MVVVRDTVVRWADRCWTAILRDPLYHSGNLNLNRDLCVVSVKFALIACTVIRVVPTVMI